MVEDAVEVFLQDFQVFRVVFGNITFAVWEICGAVFLMVGIETFYNLEDNIPCSYRVIFELFSLTVVCQETLPFSLCLPLYSLQGWACSLLYLRLGIVCKHGFGVWCGASLISWIVNQLGWVFISVSATSLVQLTMKDSNLVSASEGERVVIVSSLFASMELMYSTIFLWRVYCHVFEGLHCWFSFLVLQLCLSFFGRHLMLGNFILIMMALWSLGILSLFIFTLATYFR